jgi:hypothetical protein
MFNGPGGAKLETVLKAALHRRTSVCNRHEQAGEHTINLHCARRSFPSSPAYQEFSCWLSSSVFIRSSPAHLQVGLPTLQRRRKPAPPPPLRYIHCFEYLPRSRFEQQRQNADGGPRDQTLLASLRTSPPAPSPGGGVTLNRRPVPWLLVPGPVAGAGRLRADREVPRTSIVDDVGSESKQRTAHAATAKRPLRTLMFPRVVKTGRPSRPSCSRASRRPRGRREGLRPLLRGMRGPSLALRTSSRTSETAFAGPADFFKDI